MSPRRPHAGSAPTTTCTTSSCCRWPARSTGPSTSRCSATRCEPSRGTTAPPRWPPPPQPPREHAGRAGGAPAGGGEPVIDTVLKPGDALYLPRGFLHSATALGEISAHLTIGIHPVTRWAAAEAALDLVRTLAAGDPALRGSLPLGVDLTDPDAVRDDVIAVIEGLRDWLTRVDPAEVADSVRARTWAQVRPEPVAPLAQSAAAAALSAETVLRLRRRLRCSLREAPDGRVMLLAGRRTHTFPAEVPAALSELLAVGELKVGDLPGLDRDDRLTVARRLVTESIATVPDASPYGPAHDPDQGDRHDGDHGDALGTGR